MSCEFCEKFDFSSVTTKIDKYGAGIQMSGGSYRFPVKEWFNYCPICGKKLPSYVFDIDVKEFED